MALKRGIEKAVEVCIGEVKTMSTKVANDEKIAQVGTISANGDAPRRTRYLSACRLARGKNKVTR